MLIPDEIVLSSELENHPSPHTGPAEIILQLGIILPIPVPVRRRDADCPKAPTHSHRLSLSHPTLLPLLSAPPSD